MRHWCWGPALLVLLLLSLCLLAGATECDDELGKQCMFQRVERVPARASGSWARPCNKCSEGHGYGNDGCTNQCLRIKQRLPKDKATCDSPVEVELKKCPKTCCSESAQEWSSWSSCREECMRIACNDNCGKEGKKGVSTTFMQKCDPDECKDHKRPHCMYRVSRRKASPAANKCGISCFKYRRLIVDGKETERVDIKPCKCPSFKYGKDKDKPTTPAKTKVKWKRLEDEEHIEAEGLTEKSLPFAADVLKREEGRRDITDIGGSVVTITGGGEGMKVLREMPNFLAAMASPASQNSNSNNQIRISTESKPKSRTFTSAYGSYSSSEEKHHQQQHSDSNTEEDEAATNSTSDDHITVESEELKAAVAKKDIPTRTVARARAVRSGNFLGRNAAYLTNALQSYGSRSSSLYPTYHSPSYLTHPSQMGTSNRLDDDLFGNYPPNPQPTDPWKKRYDDEFVQFDPYSSQNFVPKRFSSAISPAEVSSLEYYPPKTDFEPKTFYASSNHHQLASNGNSGFNDDYLLNADHDLDLFESGHRTGSTSSSSYYNDDDFFAGSDESHGFSVYIPPKLPYSPTGTNSLEQMTTLSDAKRPRNSATQIPVTHRGDKKTTPIPKNKPVRGGSHFKPTEFPETYNTPLANFVEYKEQQQQHLAPYPGENTFFRDQQVPTIFQDEPLFSSFEYEPSPYRDYSQIPVVDDPFDFPSYPDTPSEITLMDGREPYIFAPYYRSKISATPRKGNKGKGGAKVSPKRVTKARKNIQKVRKAKRSKQTKVKKRNKNSKMKRGKKSNQKINTNGKDYVETTISKEVGHSSGLKQESQEENVGEEI